MVDCFYIESGGFPAAGLHTISWDKGSGIEKMNYTYILKCKDGSLYTGWTNDIENRLENHRSGKGAKYTKGRGPLELVYLEVSDTKSEAMRREAYIKRLTKVQKLDLLRESNWKERLGEWKLEDLKIKP